MPRGKKKRKPPMKVSDDKAQIIAVAIVRNDRSLKQIAADFGISYQWVYRILRERVNVSKVLSLRYSDTPEEK